MFASWRKIRGPNSMGFNKVRTTLLSRGYAVAFERNFTPRGLSSPYYKEESFAFGAKYVSDRFTFELSRSPEPLVEVLGVVSVDGGQRQFELFELLDLVAPIRAIHMVPYSCAVRFGVTMLDLGEIVRDRIDLIEAYADGSAPEADRRIECVRGARLSERIRLTSDQLFSVSCVQNRLPLGWRRVD